MEKYKTIKEKKDLYIEFSEDEMKELGWKENQKLSMSLTEDGGISIQPLVNVEIDMSGYSPEILHWLIKQSADNDISINEVISNILETFIEDDKVLNKLKKKHKDILLCENKNV